MQRRTFLTAAAALIAVPAAALANNDRLTIIHCQNIHCASCARKIAGKLYAVPGVVEVKISLKTHRVFVKPQAQLDPDPQALWNAVVDAGTKPVKLVGPAGTLTGPSST